MNDDRELEDLLRASMKQHAEQMPEIDGVRTRRRRTPVLIAAAASPERSTSNSRPVWPTAFNLPSMNATDRSSAASATGTVMTTSASSGPSTASSFLPNTTRY